MMSLAKLVLMQTSFHNGHGQMEISEMSISDALHLCRDMEKENEEPFTLEVWCEKDGKHGAYIHQQDGIKYGVNKLWLSIDNLIV